jgi:hypothetical protein
MAEATDPSWLLSTCAQSAAALVAIVGGLLVSRLVTLASERRVIRERLKALQERRRLLEDEHERLAMEVSNVAHQFFIELAIDDYAEHRGEVAAEDTLENHWPLGASESEVLTWARQLRHEVEVCYAAIEGALHSSDVAISEDVLMSRGVDKEAFHAEVFDRVLAAVATQRRRFPGSRRRVKPLPSPTRERATLQQEAISRRDGREGEIKAYEAEENVARETLRDLATPRGVVAALIILCYLAAVGIIAPLIMLALRPVPSGAIERASIVTLFSLGVVALMGYMFWMSLEGRRD